VSSVVKMPTLRYNRVSSAVIKNAQSWTLYIIYLILVTQVITHKSPENSMSNWIFTNEKLV
jgi:hypothetical protein